MICILVSQKILSTMRKRCTGQTWKCEPSSSHCLSLQDSDEEQEEEMALQSGSEGTSSEPREDHTDASSVDVTSSRPRRAATLRRAINMGNAMSNQEAAEGRRRSTRSLSAYNQNNNKYQPSKGQEIQVRKTTHQPLHAVTEQLLHKNLRLPPGCLF